MAESRVVPAAEAQVPCGPDEAPANETPTPRFAELSLSPAIQAALDEMGYTHPTAVQHAVLTPALQKRDLLVQSKTGSGKTCAFGIPLLTRLVGGAAPREPQGLVLLPTRELAHQVAEELTRLSAHQKSRVLPVYGGLSLDKQAKALGEGVDVVVATPGRLLDLYRRKHIRLQAVQTVVLDEADEMLSMGFWDDVTEIIRYTPKERQTLLFSATLPYEVAKSATQLMREPLRLDLSGDDLTVDGIDNRIVHVQPQMPKPRQMLYVLEGAQAKSAIIFCNTRNETEMLAKYLTQSGFEAEPISGNLKQKDRERTMARIKSGQLRYMVATDIAARGIDITDLSHVFNYALPEFCEVYLHRVGRTGRNGKVGVAVSLVDGRGLGTLSVLEKQFGIAFTEMTLPPEEDVLRARSRRIMQELIEKAGMAELSQHLPAAQNIVGHAEGPQVVAFLLKAYFNGQAAQKTASPATAPQPSGSAAATDAEPSDEADEALSDEGKSASGRRRRRRRGRGRGRAGVEGEADETFASAEAPPKAAAAPSAPYEIVDAIDWLGGREALRQKDPEHEQDAPAPAPRAPRPRRGAEAPRAAGAAGEAKKKPEPQEAPQAPLPAGQKRIRVNIGFNDGFKGRGAVAKKIAALAGLNEGTLTELDAKREHATLRASDDIAELVLERVDGAQLGKKVIAVTIA